MRLKEFPLNFSSAWIHFTYLALLLWDTYIRVINLLFFFPSCYLSLLLSFQPYF